MNMAGGLTQLLLLLSAEHTEALLESFNTTAGINDLLLAGEEWVA